MDPMLRHGYGNRTQRDHVFPAQADQNGLGDYTAINKDTSKNLTQSVKDLITTLFTLVAGGDVSLTDLQNVLKEYENQPTPYQSANTMLNADTQQPPYTQQEMCPTAPVQTPPAPDQQQTPPKTQTQAPQYHAYQPAPVVTRVTAGGDKGTAYGDPHFNGFDGEVYDVQGQNGKIYNILSDRDIQYNAKFDAFAPNPGSTVMSEAGIRLGSNLITFDPRNQKASATKGNGDIVNLMDGKEHSFNGDTVQWHEDSKTLSIQSREYNINLHTQEWGTPNAYIDNEVSITAAGTMGDGVASHGLLGQTADGDGRLGTLNGFNGNAETRSGDTGANAQGGGVIEMIDANGQVGVSQQGDQNAVNAYEEKSLFSTGSIFSRFGLNPNDVGMSGRFERLANGDIRLKQDGQIIFRAAPDETAGKVAETEGAAA